MQTGKLADDYINTDINHGGKHITRWIVTLDNGVIVYQDDVGQGNLRPGTHLTSWERLQNYCGNNKNYIVDMKLQFRSHIENMPANVEGYFFRRSILGGIGIMRTSRIIPDTFFYLVGILKDGKVTIQKWRVPELILNTDEEDIRDPDDFDNCGKSLIRKDAVNV